MNYDNIQYCMNILFDYYYGGDTGDCYNFDKIAMNSITIEDIKKQSSFDPTDVLKAGFTYKGVVGEKHMFVRKGVDTEYDTLVYFGKYKKDTDRSSLTLRENNGSKISYILSELGPFIVLPVMNFDIASPDLAKLNSSIAKIVKNNAVIYVQVREHFNKLEPLSSFLKGDVKPDNYYKIIIFHVLFALYKITKRHPTFLHNKLNLDSVFIHHRADIDSMQQYDVNGVIFNVPSLGFEVKLDNFEDASIGDLLLVGL